MFDYRQISSDLIKDLPDRTGDIISRRFGLNKNSYKSKESLESIGVDYGITRERVRQIESDGLSKIENRSKKYNSVFSELRDKISDFGGLKKEDLYIKSLGDIDMRNHIFFLLSVNDNFSRFSENKDFHSFWRLNDRKFEDVKSAVVYIKDILQREKKPLKIDDCLSMLDSKSPSKINSYLEISKDIHLTDSGMFGLKDWPEINPKGIKDKAYLTLKKSAKPLHFREIAKKIGESVLPQTVHNELIKDKRFVLVGRGVYALGEWGYEPGEVKDVIKRILEKAGRPMNRREIVEEVLKRRVVKENTVIQNLSNKEYFRREPGGGYVTN